MRRFSVIPMSTPSWRGLFAALLSLVLPAAASAGELTLTLQTGPARDVGGEAPALVISDTLALMLNEDEAILWERETGRELARTPAQAEPWQQWVVDVPEGELRGLRPDSAVTVFQLSTLTALREHAALPVEDGRVWSPELSADGRWRLATILPDADDPHLEVDDLVTGARYRLPVSEARGQRPPSYPEVAAALAGYALATEGDGALTVFTGEGCWSLPDDREGACPATLPARIRGEQGLRYWGVYSFQSKASADWRPPTDGVSGDPRAILVTRDDADRAPVQVQLPTPLPAFDAWLTETELISVAQGDEGLLVRRASALGGDWVQRDAPLRADAPFSRLEVLGDTVLLITQPHAGGFIQQAQVSARVGGLTGDQGPGVNPRKAGKAELWVWEHAPDGAPHPACEGLDLLPSTRTPVGTWTYASAPGPLVDTRRYQGFALDDPNAPPAPAELKDLLSCETVWTSPEPGQIWAVGEARDWVAWSPTTGKKRQICVSELSGGAAPRCVKAPEAVDMPAPAPGQDAVLGLSGDGAPVQLLDVRSLRWRPAGASQREVALASDDVRTRRRSADGRWWLTTHSDDPALRLWRAEDGALAATLLSFADGSWVVLDPEGRFDREGETEGLHWVWRDGDTLESIGLDQLERYYYEPGLLAKILDPDLSPRPLVGFDPSRLPPRVSWTRSGDALEVTLTNRGGGLGPTALIVNGRELAADVRPSGLNASAPEARFTVDLAPYARFMLGEDQDQLLVQAFDANERVASRGRASPPPPGLLDPPPDVSVDLFAVVVGVHDYEDDSLDLSLPDDDAAAIARAIEAGGRSLIGDKGQVRVTLLSTGGDRPRPSRERVEAAFAEIAAEADPWDILIVFFAGHGVTKEGAYYFPFPEATQADLDDPDLLAARALSSDQLMELLRSVPAGKQLLILDTCESGGALTGGRSQLTAYAQERTLEELRQRMGLYILAGAPTGQKAYERTELGHGLLTYALLDGLRGGEHLKDGAYWDTSALLEHTVDAVPVLATSLDIPDTQNPVLSTPGEARSFVFGRLPDDVDAAIPLRSTRVPVVTGGQVIDRDQGYDAARLSEHLDRAMSAAQGVNGSMRWSPRSGGESTWRLGGAYSQTSGVLSLQLVLAPPSGAPTRAQIEGPSAEAVSECAAWWTLRALDHAAGRAQPPPAQVQAGACSSL
ncbi:MAG: caspase family protein [Alphaproteobacteria bacterium]|nr:caspase family protein [Alphaproteobacteria bacterium]